MSHHAYNVSKRGFTLTRRENSRCEFGRVSKDTFPTTVLLPDRSKNGATAGLLIKVRTMSEGYAMIMVNLKRVPSVSSAPFYSIP